MADRREYTELVEFLIDLRIHCLEDGVPDGPIESLVDRAHRWIFERRDLDDIYDLVDRIFEVWDDSSKCPQRTPPRGRTVI